MRAWGEGEGEAYEDGVYDRLDEPRAKTRWLIASFIVNLLLAVMLIDNIVTRMSPQDAIERMEWSLAKVVESEVRIDVILLLISYICVVVVRNYKLTNKVPSHYLTLGYSTHVPNSETECRSKQSHHGWSTNPVRSSSDASIVV